MDMRLELRQAIKAFMCLMIILVAIFIIITIKVTIDADNVYNFDLLVATDVTKSTVVVIPD